MRDSEQLRFYACPRWWREVRRARHHADFQNRRQSWYEKGTRNLFPAPNRLNLRTLHTKESNDNDTLVSTRSLAANSHTRNP